jgi:hypothetical protein
MKSVFIVISSILALVSPLIYAKAILYGKARPHRTTRFVLLLITTLTTASLFAQGNKVAIWLATVSTFQSIVIFALSIKHGMGGWAKIDILCLLIALLGIFLWQTTKDSTLALYCAILADFTGMIPALIKTYYQPETEISSFYLLDVFAGGFSLFAISNWTLQEYSYPIYIMLVNLVMVFLVIRPRLQTA